MEFNEENLKQIMNGIIDDKMGTFYKGLAG